MTRNSLWRVWLSQILLVAAIVALLAVVVRRTSAENGRVSLTTDWSHRHLIFSQPHSLLDSFKLSANPRYVQQWIRRNARKKGNANGETGSPSEPNLLKGDWSVYLGNLGTVGAGNFPAKFSFDITGSSCTAPQPDFIVYNTSVAGSTTPVAAVDSGAFTARSATGATITIVNGANTLVLTAAGANANTAPGIGTYNRGTAGNSLTIRATNLVNAINLAGNGSFVGITASSVAAEVTITATTPGAAGNTITATSSTTPASHFAWDFSNFVDGAPGVATVAAYDNLYTGCTGAVPSPYWAYNTGTGATAATSVTLSKDGQQVAFVQNVGAGGVGAQLVLLKWAAGTSSVDNPQDLTGAGTNVSNANYRACTAPCMTTINFSGGVANVDTNSSPFYDYTPGSDTLYVGDNAGSLHQFTGVFSGTPAETISTGADVWPAIVSTGNILTSPVYDANVGQIFVGDNAVSLHRVDQTIGSGAGGIVSTAALGNSGITAAPTVDSSIGNVYVFVRGDTSAGGGRRAAVCQFSTSFTAAATCIAGGANHAAVSSNNILPLAPFNNGDFDDLYYSSANGTGNLYVCSTALAAGVTHTALWQVPITAGVLGTPVQGPQITIGDDECSPITEFKNGATDRIFVSNGDDSKVAAPITCPSNTVACIMSFDITNPALWGTGTGTSATALVPGGASGIIVDGSAGPTGSSQVYYSTLGLGSCLTASGQGRGGCAVQASQATLQ